MRWDERETRRERKGDWIGTIVEADVTTSSQSQAFPLHYITWATAFGAALTHPDPPAVGRNKFIFKLFIALIDSKSYRSSHTTIFWKKKY